MNSGQNAREQLLEGTREEAKAGHSGGERSWEKRVAEMGSRVVPALSLSPRPWHRLGRAAPSPGETAVFGAEASSPTPSHFQPLTPDGLSSRVFRETRHFRFLFFLSDHSSHISNSFPFLCLALKH